jgi:hypothetical protein
MANRPDVIGAEFGLGRSALSHIGRHLGAMYDDVVADQMPEPLAAALQRLRSRDESSPSNDSPN